MAISDRHSAALRAHQSVEQVVPAARRRSRQKRLAPDYGKPPKDTATKHNDTLTLGDV